MDCIKCGEANPVETYFIEELPCPHCDGTVRIEYYVCKSCGITWKAMDGDVLAVADFDLETTGDDEEVNVESGSEVLGFSASGFHNGPAMGELLHSCIKCGSIAFETGRNKWKCTDTTCAFEWEVIDCG